MSYVALVVIILLIQYFFFAMSAGAARGKGGVKAPAVSGDENFERALRVQMNTLEQLIITLPAMWICATYFSANVAAVLGIVFLIGRFVYWSAYMGDPAKRGTGMMIGVLANGGLVGCSLYALAISLI